MLKKIMMAALAAGAVALNAPVASAAVAAVDCGFNTVAQETATGGQDTFTGAAYGYIVSDAGETVTVRCEVRVDGGAQDSTDPGSGTGAAVTGGQVTYTASDTQDVDLCAVYTVNGGPETSVCGETTTTQVPPQEVIDLIDSLFTTLEPVFETIDQILFDVTSIPDATLCPILASLTPGIPGVVDIDSEGDVAIAGIGFWDCPPYGS